MKHDLDAFFLATNAPGRSAFNGVKRGMAPLSHDLAGVVLPLNRFGNHLNRQNETIDEELQMKNFAKAGEILAEIWSRTVIDGNTKHLSLKKTQNGTESMFVRANICCKQ